MALKTRTIIFNILCITSLLAATACKKTATKIATLDPVYAEVKKEILTVATDTTLPAYSGLRNKTAVAQFYTRFGTDPIWLRESDHALADSMLIIVRKAHYYGLVPSKYHLVELENLSRARNVRRELLLTDAFLVLAGDLKFGVQEFEKKRKEDSLRIELLTTASATRKLLKTLEGQEPKLQGYRSLKKGLSFLLDSAHTYSQDSMSFYGKIRLISINMERWRRENSRLEGRYIFINIPSFMLQVIDGDSVTLSSRVIVGTPNTPTPVLSSVVECFTIYPYWHVPRKIAVQEYLPIIKKDSTFLHRNNFDVLDRKGNVLNDDSIAWQKFNQNYFPVVLRQREGTDNSLGIVKFIFDNPHAVFLHDTNAKRLFKSTTRAFSHGCIRMEKAVQLAHYLVTGSVHVQSNTVANYLKEKQQHRINVKRPIPIYTRYLTCDYQNNVLRSYKDVYNQDQALYDLIYRDTPESNF